MMFHAEYDLTAHKPARIAAVLEASEDFDPATALAGEGGCPAGVDELDDLAYHWFDAA